MRKTCVLRRLPSGPITGRRCRSRPGLPLPAHIPCAASAALPHPQLPHEPLDAVVAGREPVIANQILIDPLGAEILAQLGRR